MNHDNGHQDYADRDIRLQPIVVFIIITVLVTIASVVGLKVLFDRYEQQQTVHSVAMADRMMEASRPTNAVVEGLGEAAIAMKQLRAEEDARLNHYRWIDQDSGVVQIPVERAMQVVVEKQVLDARKSD